MYQQSAPETIQAMFASIAEKYDFANAAFTFGLYKKWNGRLIDAVDQSKKLLDLCAGTGEIALGFLKKNAQAEAILLDFCPEMLTIAQKKMASLNGRFEIIQGDAQAIPLAAQSVDAVTISYGIRNVSQPEKVIQEAYRVLIPNGRFGILELTRPSSWFLKKSHHLYTRLILPMLGKMTAKNIQAYKYLASSVETFAPPEQLETGLREAGFQKIQRRSLMGGITTLFIATK